MDLLSNGLGCGWVFILGSLFSISVGGSLVGRLLDSRLLVGKLLIGGLLDGRLLGSRVLVVRILIDRVLQLLLWFSSRLRGSYMGRIGVSRVVIIRFYFSTEPGTRGQPATTR